MESRHEPALQPRVPIDPERLAAFCKKWNIAEFALFGSVLTDDFRPDSDVDVLVTFVPDTKRPGFDWVDMVEELGAIFGRDIDLVSKDALINPFRRAAILDSSRVIYRAA